METQSSQHFENPEALLNKRKTTDSRIFFLPLDVLTNFYVPEFFLRLSDAFS